MRDPAYVPPPPREASRRYLVASAGTPDESRYPFYDRIEIGRSRPGQKPAEGVLLIDDPTVSRRHCVLTRDSRGRVFVRDVSRNGTRVEGRRLVPNVEFQLESGQVLTIGSGHSLLFEEADGPVHDETPSGVATYAVHGATPATVLVGDIRDFTVMVREVPAETLQPSVSRVFELLGRDVERLGGTVKEYPGDALFAFWEGADFAVAADRACAAALMLHARSQELARQDAVWSVPDHPLQLDWALATGLVAIEAFGGAHPTGLSAVGEPVVLAFRLEKYAHEETGPIVACGKTAAAAGVRFGFRDLGEFQAKGFESPDRIYELTGEIRETEPTSPVLPQESE